MHRKITAAAAGAGLAMLSALATAGSAEAHGYTTSPTSRQAFCAQGAVSDCGEIVWEPQSVEGPKGFPSAGPADGAICSGGNSRFSQLDDPRGGAWPATDVSAGQSISFTWTFTASHSTSDFRYYLTNDSYDPSQPLTRADLEPEPFLTVSMDGAQPGETETHTGTLPAGKSGRHLVLAVWDIADTGNAFYACSDVQF
ncbi:lytic polysaccharide monooxygenase [Streptomyces sp. 7-21]|uniref:lytic polysaccharide monooxygenase auxiliary activity family 9 protein n=1 Tax=Streptomyces sp. 7-21 TaxID=2802283 RepID=UPI001920111D|nr:lytic polysaccharide monooxygenase auxiliary activity family 9 protein [Streptomyces sp. 7-21]MBL1066896.1 lytic polysaccharide monooxygenase [Streptomyces sp. 7-21]